MEYESFLKELVKYRNTFLFLFPQYFYYFLSWNCGERGGVVVNGSGGEVEQKEQSTLWTSYLGEEIYVQ